MSKRGKRKGRNIKGGRKSLRGVKYSNAKRRVAQPKRRPNKQQRHRPAPRGSSTRSAPSAASDFASKVSLLETKERSLQSRINLDSIESDLNHIDAAFLDIPLKINEVNKRGFVFTRDMDEALALAEDEWLSGLENELDRELSSGISKVSAASNALDRVMLQLSKPNQFIIDKAESEIDELDNLIRSTEQAIRGRYSAIKATIDEIYGDLNEANWGLDLLNDSEIDLRGSESIVQVAEAEWEIDGEDEGPDGYLYLTDQRLLFEQKEEVAEKKFMFITTKSTEVQKLLVDTELRHIGTIEQSQEKRRRLQWGSDEILSMTITGQADLSRLRFHLKNQQAEDWKETMQFVLSGEIQEDRFDFDPESADEEYIFPATCPSCMAAVPPVPRGVLVYECEFCGSSIQARKRVEN